MIEYNKPFLSIEKQISLLKERGLIIGDKQRAEFFLHNISYYHLSIYTKAFQNEENKFKQDTDFDDVISLYNFDKRLRLLLLDMLERIEMSLKCVLAYEVTRYKDDNYWYAKGDNFKNGEDDIENILKGIVDSSEIYIKHYYDTYSDPGYPPAWMFFESLTFGQSVRLARNFFDTERQIIAGFYKLPKKTVTQMFYYLSHLRNVCAHHSRVWNRRFVSNVAKHPKYENIFGDTRRGSLYAYFVVMQIFLVKISPTSTWLDKLDGLIKEHDIVIYRMGFPNDWRIHA